MIEMTVFAIKEARKGMPVSKRTLTCASGLPTPPELVREHTIAAALRATANVHGPRTALVEAP